ncbi:MAG: hypothetical protein JSV82_02015 [Planctomycetota bacterium]|nr:MAG: hypothetical protein JSV82_02015 [Planctomycetota bacterium]
MLNYEVRRAEGRPSFAKAMEGKGGNIAPAWKTIAKVNGVTFAPADSVLFEADQPWWVMENENTARFCINRHYGLSVCFFLYCPGEQFS